MKFLFATTEVNKVPVTVLSRCQRFDLRRIPAEKLAEHFAQVSAAEGVEAEPEALALIARAAEGSARDGLSILDQAIAHAGIEGGGVPCRGGARRCSGCRTAARSASCSGCCSPATRWARWRRCAGNMISASIRRRCCARLLETVHGVTLAKLGAEADAGAIGRGA